MTKWRFHSDYRILSFISLFMLSKHIVFIAFGSSLGDRIAYIENAITLLQEQHIVSSIFRSSYYRSTPIDAPGDFYINSVIRCITTLTPYELLAAIHTVEESCGRKRYAHHNMRTIDIDILLYDRETLETSDLILPHPRMQDRWFVMLPLREIEKNIERYFTKTILPDQEYLAQGIEKLSGREIQWKWKYATMGILNITPDSFYDGWNSLQLDTALEKIWVMLQEGADIIDIGWQSTRPGHTPISPQEELSRIRQILPEFRKKFPHTPMSIDTFYRETAEFAIEYWVDIINDISAKLMYNTEFMERCIQSKCTYVLMSTDHDITSMQWFFETSIVYLRSIWMQKVILDPWFGFWKTQSENYTILSNLLLLHDFCCPIMAWISRKSMIYKTLWIHAAQALNGTTALHMLSLLQGAQILRVHDVRECRETITLYNYFQLQKNHE